MATIGYCHDCDRWVTLGTDWSCPMGHPAARVNGWYDDETGQAIEPPAPGGTGRVAGAPARPSAAPSTRPAPGTRAALLTELMGVLTGETAYHASWGTDTDVVIEANPVDVRWGSGHKRADYAAALKVVEAERAVYFWETLKERGHAAPLGFESEAYAVGSAQDPAAKREVTIGPGSTSWEWGHGTLRTLVEDVAARHGYRVHFVLTKRAASY